MLENPDIINNRKWERTRVFMAAHLSYGNGAILISCTVRNTSDGGAKIQISGDVILPREFQLIILRGDVRRLVHLCWRTKEFCGVTFLDKGAELAHAQDRNSKEKEAALRLKIRHLEGIIAQMQQRIEQLSSG
ncbi:MAG: hypothetical protein ACNA7Y_06350 [Gammaproteobacteria bacterium]